MTRIVLGMEVAKVDPDPDAPWRMTLDVFSRRDGIIRHQLTGKHYEHVERTPELVARAAGYTLPQSVALDRLDREYAAKIRDAAEWLRREQIRTLYGDTEPAGEVP